MAFLAVEGVFVDVFIENHVLKMAQANLNFKGQFVEPKINGKTTEIGLRPEMDIFIKDEKSGQDENITTRSRRTDDKNSTDSLREENKLTLTSNHTLGKLQFGEKAEISKEELQRKDIEEKLNNLGKT